MENMFGNRLKFLREYKGITQEELANKLGYSHKSSICKIEDGSRKVPAYKLPKFAEALGCTVEELINFERPTQNMYLPTVSSNDAEAFNDNVDAILKAESLQNILKMLSEMDTKQIIKVEKVIRTLSED